jgi:hypothetical protein
VIINSVDVPPNALVGARYGAEVADVAASSFSQATAAATLVGAGFVAIGVLGSFVGFRRRAFEDGSADDVAPSDDSAESDESGATDDGSDPGTSVDAPNETLSAERA